MDLHTLLNPSSIAIVGVSQDPRKVGYLTAKNLLDQGFGGTAYFINHSHTGEILGKKIYASLLDTETIPEAVVLAIPAHAVVDYLDIVAQKGVKNVVVFSAGFKEIGKEGVENERLFLEKIRKYSLNVLGPNCIGFINTQKNINTTFLKLTSPSGNIGMVSQSGALGSVMVDYFAAHKNLGFSYFVSLGNKSVIDECDVLEYLFSDNDTKVIGMYLEDVKRGRHFMEVLKKVSREKPIVILKAGSTDEGSKAAISHTGSMVGSDYVYSAVFKQCGAIRADSFTQFTNILKIYSYDRIPYNKSVLILSNAGGAGVLAADDIIKHSMSLVTVSEETQKKLKESLNENRKVSLHNPIDLLGDASAFEYKKAIESTIAEKDIGAITVLLTPQANTQIQETAEEIVSVQSHFEHPIYPIFMGEESLQTVRLYFEAYRVAGFASYDELFQCLEKILWREEFFKGNNNEISLPQVAARLMRPKIEEVLIQHTNKPFLDFENSLKILQSVGIPTVPTFNISNEAELKEIAKQLIYPVVLKIASDIVTHKTEVGGVVTGISSMEAFETAFKNIIATGKAKGGFVQPMIKGQELFIGAKRDEIFGTVIVMGLGGIYTELLKDVSYRIHPFSSQEFGRMMKETKAKRLVEGFRGSQPVQVDKLYEVLQTVGYIMDNFEQIKEIDINPLFLTEGKLLAADCRIVLA